MSSPCSWDLSQVPLTPQGGARASLSSQPKGVLSECGPRLPKEAFGNHVGKQGRYRTQTGSILTAVASRMLSISSNCVAQTGTYFHINEGFQGSLADALTTRGNPPRLTGSVQVQRGPRSSRRAAVSLTRMAGMGLPPEGLCSGGSVAQEGSPAWQGGRPQTLLPPPQGSPAGRKVPLESGPESSSSNAMRQGAAPSQRPATASCREDRRSI